MGKKLFDYVIGNPPYQEDTQGTSDTPVYDRFMDSAFTVADKVELVHPARFLFNAGKTPKAWNEKMLNDPHFKVLQFEQDSGKIFPNTDIKGGIAISYRDANIDYGAIEVFTHFKELDSIKRKVSGSNHFLSEIIYAPESYKFSKTIHEVMPGILKLLSKGHDYDLTTNIFDKLDGIAFFDKKLNDGYEYIQIYGRQKNDRIYKYIRKDFIAQHENLEKWKVFLPKSNGSGAIGEVLSTPLCGTPLCGHNQSFISFGSFDTEFEANACLKYIKTKFARACLGILKITQHNAKATWRYVPLQDFSSNSDIDWSKSVHEIDLQLYRKYGLSEEEIAFIETHVKEMA